MALPIIDARVHVSRTIAPWPRARETLRRAGIDTALLTAHPESPQLSDDITLPLDVAGPDGPWAALYVGGNPFSGHRRGPIRVPHDLERYHALHIRCFLSPSLDFGAATTSSTWEPEELQAAVGREDLGALIEAAHALGMAVWLTEHFPVTLELIDRFPQVRFVIPRMGAMNGGAAQVVNMLARYDNVYFDTSCGELHEAVVRRIGAQRILLASGHPFNDPAEALDQVGHLDLPDDDIAAIAGGNLLGLLPRRDRSRGRAGE